MSAQPDFKRTTGDSLDFLSHDCGRIARNVDWAATALGPPQTWSPALRMMMKFTLANRFPQMLWWGPEYVCSYNDAYAPVLGAKHPWAMGKPVKEVWGEIWEVLRPLIDTPFMGGPSTWIEDFELDLHRHGFVEECHFTVAYSPVPDETAPRGIGGVLATIVEITDKVISERRVEILRELGSRVAESKSDVDACTVAINILAQHLHDVPFAMLYLLDRDGRRLRLVSRTGIEAETAGAAEIDLEGEASAARWPLAAALRAEQIGRAHV